MRYECDEPGLEANFLELSDSWSRAQVNEFWQFNKGADYNTLLQKKTVTCHLDCAEGEPLTAPEQFTDEHYLRLDVRLWDWFVTVPIKHVQALGSLGEACGRRLFVSTATNSEPTSDAPTPSPMAGS